MAVRTFSPQTPEAIAHLGNLIRLGRKQHRWTIADLAERVGVTKATVTKVEQGNPSVAIGTYIEAAVLVGVPLISADATTRSAEAQRVHSQIALLPASIRTSKVDDDF